jgi:GNAT superfamily N-acetyltransferase
MSSNGGTGLKFLDLRGKEQEPGLLEALHRDLFLPHFPNPDEQEEPDDWRPRLSEDAKPPSQQPEQHGFIAGTRLEHAERSLAGFAFVERYRESQCLLLSYIAVEEDWRGQGLARELFDRALGSAQKAAQQDGGPIRAIFAEIHDPRRVPEGSDVIDPEARVRIMERLGAWRVPISYVQPALGEGSKRSDQLMLIAFPLDGKPTVDASAVAEFLREYYGALGVEDLAGDGDLTQMEKELTEFGRTVDLSPLAPSLPFERFSVVLHFVAHEARGDEADESDKLNPFRSFEEDLLSYRYVPSRSRMETPDFAFENRTVEFEDHLKTVELSVPVPIPYYSEGLERKLYCPPPHHDDTRPHELRRLKLAVRASRTYFRKSEYSIFHLAFVGLEQQAPHSGQSDILDEYGVVALSKLWQGGEDSTLAERIRLHSPDSEQDENGLKVGEFAQRIFDGLTDTSVRVGTVQLITDSTPAAVDWTKIWNVVAKLSGPAGGDEPADKPEPSDEHGLTLTDETPCGERASTLGKQVIALGGIVQGILDFQAIDAEELSDVFKPHEVDATSLVGIHKGTLLCIMESDRSYDAAVRQIGVSPYLLLPQAVLLHNEGLLDGVAGLAKSVEAEKDRVELAECFKKMRGLLAHYVPNVFHYSQEKRLFDDGEEARGLSRRREELTERAGEIEARWNVAVEKRRTSADRVRNVLLALIGVSPFVGAGVFAGLFALGLVLVALSLHSNPRWSWWPPRSWWSFVVGLLAKRREENPGSTA